MCECTVEEEEIFRTIRGNVEKLYQKQQILKEIKLTLYLKRFRLENAFKRDLIEADRAQLSDDDKNRWDRQIRNPILNQALIKRAKIAVFGCGGIGSNVLLGLVYSGVYNLKIVDFDVIEQSNLNRTPLYVPKNVGMSKSETSQKRLLEINPAINVTPYDFTLDYPKELNLLNTKEI